MPVCPYCGEDRAAIEILGFRLHKFADRWISCSSENQETPGKTIASREPYSGSILGAMNERVELSFEIVSAQP